MRFIAGIASTLLWIVPFGYITDYGLSDWQWWFMMLGVVSYSVAGHVIDDLWPERRRNW